VSLGLLYAKLIVTLLAVKNGLGGSNCSESIQSRAIIIYIYFLFVLTKYVSQFNFKNFFLLIWLKKFRFLLAQSDEEIQVIAVAPAKNL
jgi:hypothetical protein